MAWTTLTRAQDFAQHLGIPVETLRTSRSQRSYNYVEKDLLDKKRVKWRHLCYPPRGSALREVQVAIKDRCLERLPLADAICGYRKGQHNIGCAQRIAGFPYVAKLDIKDFHPSISPELVVATLRWHGLSQPMCRLITQMVTFKRQIPQGAPTSNHIANLVVDFVLGQGVIEFCQQKGVVIANYGDDTAFAGGDRFRVDECVGFAKAVFQSNGLKANDKSTSAEHVGAARRFIGTATGRSRIDLPRKRYRQYRAELRAAVRNEKDPFAETRVSEREMRSFRAKIGYVQRMNAHKARSLRDIFFRLCRIRQDRINALRATGHPQVHKVGA